MSLNESIVEDAALECRAPDLARNREGALPVKSGIQESGLRGRPMSENDTGFAGLTGSAFSGEGDVC